MEQRLYEPDPRPSPWDLGQLQINPSQFVAGLMTLPEWETSTPNGEVRIKHSSDNSAGQRMGGRYAWDAARLTDEPDGTRSWTTLSNVISCEYASIASERLTVRVRYATHLGEELTEIFARYLYEELLPSIKRMWPEARLPGAGDSKAARKVGARPGPKPWVEDVWAWVEVNVRQSPESWVRLEWSKMAERNHERKPLVDPLRSFKHVIDPNKYSRKVEGD